ncbi:MAG TPA: biotin--[acetyl-CoA-carboxylase] ligase [Thermoanaerobaculia bacterium]|nr:biotin--[acetyl-CoA-carboxylase] ligase [Thermoanaerobaculia bacterium]
MIDTRQLVDRLHTIESVAWISRVGSTNAVARRIMAECIENELALPQAILIAGEQLAGSGRNQRSWSSPRDKGIYATAMLMRPPEELPLLPLEIATAVAVYLREVFGVDARIKWPNDILVGGKKIAGILIEARIQESRAFLLIGIGINVIRHAHDAAAATSIDETARRDFRGIDDAVVRFVEHLDARLSHTRQRELILDEWRSLTVHKPGDPVSCVIGERTISGTWTGIDEQGRALLMKDQELVPVSAGDLILL